MNQPFNFLNTLEYLPNRFQIFIDHPRFPNLCRLNINNLNITVWRMHERWIFFYTILLLKSSLMCQNSSRESDKRRKVENYYDCRWFWPPNLWDNFTMKVRIKRENESAKNWSLKASLCANSLSFFTNISKVENFMQLLIYKYFVEPGKD